MDASPRTAAFTAPATVVLRAEEPRVPHMILSGEAHKQICPVKSVLPAGPTSSGNSRPRTLPADPHICAAEFSAAAFFCSAKQKASVLSNPRHPALSSVQFFFRNMMNRKKVGKKSMCTFHVDGKKMSHENVFNEDNSDSALFKKFAQQTRNFTD